jgi:predicted Zn-dependent protease
MFSTLAAGGAFIGLRLWADHEVQLAEGAYQSNHLAEAQKHIQRALRFFLGRAATHLLAGQIARRRLQFDAATTELQEYGRQAGWSQALADEFALMRVQQGDMASAAAHFQREIANDNPNAPLYLEALVEGYLRTDQVPNAIACLQRWEQLQGDSIPLCMLRGLTRERIVNLQAAADDYRKVLELDPFADDARARLIRILLTVHEGEEALTHADFLHGREPENLEYSILLARCDLELGSGEAARALLELALKQEPENAEALAARGILAMQDGDLKQAEMLLRRATALSPRDRELIFVYMQCLRESGKIAEADEQLAILKRLEKETKTPSAIPN